ncbi:hypothetical protein [Streptomyces sp. NPDC102347]
MTQYTDVVVVGAARLGSQPVTTWAAGAWTSWPGSHGYRNRMPGPPP